jgi:hypothetical protein
MGVIICPGVHSPELTQGFLEGLGKPLDPKAVCVFPTERFPAYSAPHILKFLGEQWLDLDGRFQHPYPLPSVVLVGFSAGVVGAIGVAQVLQSLGISVKALVAIDGWGVPLCNHFPWGHFPIHRLSHDRFTHWSSKLLDQTLSVGNGSDFYADPAVSHLDLWRSPQTASGWSTLETATTQVAQLTGFGQKQYATTAAQFIQTLLIQYGELETTEVI